MSSAVVGLNPSSASSSFSSPDVAHARGGDAHVTHALSAGPAILGSSARGTGAASPLPLSPPPATVPTTDDGPPLTLPPPQHWHGGVHYTPTPPSSFTVAVSIVPASVLLAASASDQRLASRRHAQATFGSSPSLTPPPPPLMASSALMKSFDDVLLRRHASAMSTGGVVGDGPAALIGGGVGRGGSGESAAAAVAIAGGGLESGGVPNIIDTYRVHLLLRTRASLPEGVVGGCVSTPLASSPADGGAGGEGRKLQQVAQVRARWRLFQQLLQFVDSVAPKFEPPATPAGFPFPIERGISFVQHSRDFAAAVEGGGGAADGGAAGGCGSPMGGGSLGLHPGSPVLTLSVTGAAEVGGREEAMVTAARREERRAYMEDYLNAALASPSVNGLHELQTFVGYDVFLYNERNQFDAAVAAVARQRTDSQSTTPGPAPRAGVEGGGADDPVTGTGVAGACKPSPRPRAELVHERSTPDTAPPPGTLPPAYVSTATTPTAERDSLPRGSLGVSRHPHSHHHHSPRRSGSADTDEGGDAERDGVLPRVLSQTIMQRRESQSGSSSRDSNAASMPVYGGHARVHGEASPTPADAPHRARAPVRAWPSQGEALSGSRRASSLGGGGPMAGDEAERVGRRSQDGVRSERHAGREGELESEGVSSPLAVAFPLAFASVASLAASTATSAPSVSSRTSSSGRTGPADGRLHRHRSILLESTTDSHDSHPHRRPRGQRRGRSRRRSSSGSSQAGAEEPAMVGQRVRAAPPSGATAYERVGEGVTDMTAATAHPRDNGQPAVAGDLMVRGGGGGGGRCRAAVVADPAPLPTVSREERVMLEECFGMLDTASTGTVTVRHSLLFWVCAIPDALARLTQVVHPPCAVDDKGTAAIAPSPTVPGSGGQRGFQSLALRERSWPAAWAPPPSHELNASAPFMVRGVAGDIGGWGTAQQYQLAMELLPAEVLSLPSLTNLHASMSFSTFLTVVSEVRQVRTPFAAGLTASPSSPAPPSATSPSTAAASGTDVLQWVRNFRLLQYGRVFSAIALLQHAGETAPLRAQLMSIKERAYAELLARRRETAAAGAAAAAAAAAAETTPGEGSCALEGTVMCRSMSVGSPLGRGPSPSVGAASPTAPRTSHSPPRAGSEPREEDAVLPLVLPAVAEALLSPANPSVNGLDVIELLCLLFVLCESGVRIVEVGEVLAWIGLRSYSHDISFAFDELASMLDAVSKVIPFSELLRCLRARPGPWATTVMAGGGAGPGLLPSSSSFHSMGDISSRQAAPHASRASATSAAGRVGSVSRERLQLSEHVRVLRLVAQCALAVSPAAAAAVAVQTHAATHRSHARGRLCSFASEEVGLQARELAALASERDRLAARLTRAEQSLAERTAELACAQRRLAAAFPSAGEGVVGSSVLAGTVAGAGAVAMVVPLAPWRDGRALSSPVLDAGPIVYSLLRSEAVGLPGASFPTAVCLDLFPCRGREGAAGGVPCPPRRRERLSLRDEQGHCLAAVLLDSGAGTLTVVGALAPPPPLPGQDMARSPPAGKRRPRSGALPATAPHAEPCRVRQEWDPVPRRASDRTARTEAAGHSALYAAHEGGRRGNLLLPRDAGGEARGDWVWGRGGWGGTAAGSRAGAGVGLCEHPASPRPAVVEEAELLRGRRAQLAVLQPFTWYRLRLRLDWVAGSLHVTVAPLTPRGVGGRVAGPTQGVFSDGLATEEVIVGPAVLDCTTFMLDGTGEVEGLASIDIYPRSHVLYAYGNVCAMFDPS